MKEVFEDMITWLGIALLFIITPAIISIVAVSMIYIYQKVFSVVDLYFLGGMFIWAYMLSFIITLTFGCIRAEDRDNGRI